MKEIALRRAVEPAHFKVRLEEPVEDKLFAVVEQLNRVQHGPTKARLTQQDAEAIRARVAAGETQKAVAADYRISTGLCCQIIKGDIWNPAEYRVGTKGSEMRRRLIAAFDGGMRRGEMMLTQIKHVTWTPKTILKGDEVITAYEIVLPPTITKGGKTSGENEIIYAATPRFREMLEQRRFQLRRRTAAGKMEPDPEAYIFGTEAGRYQKDFDRMWQALFTLADLDYGRNKGLVWHTTRHEFISRIAENTGDPVLTQELARHKDAETTQLYTKAREHRKLAAAAGLSRG